MSSRTRFQRLAVLAWLVVFGSPSGQAAIGPLGGFSEGDLLINGFGGPFDSSIGHYSLDGTLLTTFLGDGELWEGASLTPDRRVITTRRTPFDGVNIFDSDGLQVFTFDTPEVTFVAADINVFSDGVIAVNDQEGDVDLYTQEGIYLTTFMGPDMDRTTGGFVDAEDNLWVCDPRTLGSSNGAIYKFSRDGRLLFQWELDWEPGDLVVVADGTIWASDRNSRTAMHLSAKGALIDSFPTAVQGNFGTIAVGLDGSILAVGDGAYEVLRYSPDGALLGGFPLVHPGNQVAFMTVVPADRPCEIQLRLERATISLGDVLEFSLHLTHHRSESVTVPLAFWIEDSAGRVIASRVTAPRTIERGDELMRGHTLEVPESLAPGVYELVVGVEEMQQGTAWASRSFEVEPAR